MVALWLPRLLLASLCARVFAADDPPTPPPNPVAVPPSQFWDGKDGPWSTFRIEAGTDAQQVRVLPASGQSSTWLVLPEICSGDEQSCADSHGELFRRNESSTWDEFGQYELSPYLEKRVALDGLGLFGFDKLSLGWTGDGLPSLENESIAGIVAQEFYLGSLALNPRPVNFTDYNNPIPSLMQNLKDEEKIPSLSWSYTAGAYNLAPKVFGNLVLGGYDTTRFEPNDLTFPFGDDISLDFQVAVQNIESDDQTLLSTAIIAYISTLVADLWLPESVCERFEEAFGLVWDEVTELYLMDDTLHDSLLDQNPTVSFRVGPQASGDSITINMPYWNFYHTATEALTGNTSSMYFPLKRAVNDTQYVLGRTFLQSAHLSADYERNNFNLSQALFPSSSTDADIVAVLPPGSAPSTNGDDSSEASGNSSGLSVGAIAGVAVGVVVLLVVVLAIFIIRHRRKKMTKRADKAELPDTGGDGEIHHEVPGDDVKYEVGEGMRHEVAGDSDPKIELSAGADQQKPVEVDGSQLAVYEMPAEDFRPRELEGEGHVVEMSGESHTEHKENPPAKTQAYQDLP